MKLPTGKASRVGNFTKQNNLQEIREYIFANLLKKCNTSNHQNRFKFITKTLLKFAKTLVSFHKMLGCNLMQCYNLHFYPSYIFYLLCVCRIPKHQ